MEIGSIIGDKPKQEEGAWIKFNNEVSFLLVYSDSKVPRNFFVSRFSKLRQKARGAIPPMEKQQELTLDMLVKHVVKGWKGLTDKGQPFEYNEVNCRKLLEESTVIRDFIAAEAADISNFGGVLDSDEDAGEEEVGPAADMKSGPAVES